MSAWLVSLVQIYNISPIHNILWQRISRKNTSKSELILVILLDLEIGEWMRGTQKSWPALITPSPALITPFPDSKLPNREAPSVPRSIPRNPPFCF